MSEDTNAQNTDNENEQPQGSQPVSGQGEQTTTPTGPILTQAEVNKLIGKTRQEARESARKAILEDLGIEDVDSLKAILEDAKKRKEAEMTELEKAQAQIDAANKKAEEERQAREELEQKMLANARQQAFIKAATNGGGQDVDDLFILVQAKHGNDFVSVFDDKGIPDDKKMDAFIKQVQSSFSNYFGTASAGSPSNAGGVAPSSSALDNELEKQLKKKFGKL